MQTMLNMRASWTDIALTKPDLGLVNSSDFSTIFDHFFRLEQWTTSLIRNLNIFWLHELSVNKFTLRAVPNNIKRYLGLKQPLNSVKAKEMVVLLKCRKEGLDARI